MNKFVANIYKCKRVNQLGAQQLHLDCIELKTKFLSLHAKSSSFTGIVNRLFHKTECLLKVLSSPADRIQESYQSLIANPDPADFERILNLVSMKKGLFSRIITIE